MNRTLRVLLKAPLSPYSGWGQDGIGLALAINSLGIETRLQPLEVLPPLPAQIAQLLTLPLEPSFDLLIAHVAADRSGLSPAERAASRKRILWSMWEWSTFANHPHVDAIRESLASYDAVVAYDPVSAGAFQRLMPPEQPLLSVQGGIDSRAWPFAERSWRPPIRFLLVGHITDRKNPGAALAAFSQLLEEHGPDHFNAELHIKNVDRNNPFLWPCVRGSASPPVVETLAPALVDLIHSTRKYERVFFDSGTWRREEVLQLYHRMHCLLAPSRGEGKNLVALEFLSTGGTVIASDLGGHSVWMDEQYAYPLRCSLRPASWPIATAEALEGDPELGHLKELMWEVYCDPEAARAKGRAGSIAIPAQYDWTVAYRRLITELLSVGIVELTTAHDLG